MKAELDTKDWSIEVILNREDIDRLDSGEEIGTRYNGYDKILLHRKYPIKFTDDPTETMKSWISSLKQKEYAIWDRNSSDIDVYIPQGVIRHGFIGAINMGVRTGMLEIKPYDKMFENANIRVAFNETINKLA